MNTATRETSQKVIAGALDSMGVDVQANIKASMLRGSATAPMILYILIVRVSNLVVCYESSIQ